ncbi:MAG: molybdopterin oxidoreductase family protein [Microscillaceae bacterium]
MKSSTHLPQLHYRTCNLCEAMCGLEIEYQSREVRSIRGDAQDPFSRGHLCPKAYGLKDVFEDPDRLKSPQKRTASGWHELPWEEALEEAAYALQNIQKKYGSDAVGLYLGNPNAHNLGAMLMGPLFYRSLKTPNRFSATSVDQLPHHFVARYMFGHQLLFPIPDIDRTQYMLILGGNPLASNGSLMTVPDVGRRLRAIQERGGQVVVIDPRRTETAQKASVHHFIRPGTDALFLLALLHEITVSHCVRPGHLTDFTEGIEEIATMVAPYAPERVAEITGIAPEAIRQIARDFCEAPSAVAYGRMGVSTQAFGALAQWLINVLNILTGNLDRPGGAMFTLPAVDVVGLTGLRGAVGSHGRWKSRVRGLPEFGGELPVSVLAEEILTPGEGQIRAMVTVAGNPVLSTPNGRQLDKAFAQLDFMLAIDIYRNETTRHAHLILPPTTGLEVDHFDLVFNYLAVRNTVKFSPRLFEPKENTRADWQILRALAQKMKPAPAKKSKDPLERLSPEALLDLALRYGPYGSKGAAFYKTQAWGKDGLKMHTLRQYPHGLDLGPLQPLLPQRLFTKNKRIDLLPEILTKDLKRLHKAFFETKASTSEWPFQLIGRRHLRSNNSWMHNSPRLVRGRNRCTLMMHLQDAQTLNLQNGEKVKVRSRVGTIEIDLETTDSLMPGVVSIPHGWGHHRPGTHWQVAEANAGVSANDLTDEHFLDELCGNAALNGVPVVVEKIKIEEHPA